MGGEATVTWSQRLWGFVCYVGPLVAIPYFLRRDDPFVGFHARQGLRGFLVVTVSVIVIAGLPLLVFALVPGMNPTWVILPAALLFVVLMLVWFKAAVEVLAGHTWHVPIIGSRVEADMLAHEEEARYRREHAPATAAAGLRGP